MPGACEWNKSKVDGGGSRILEFDFCDIRTLGAVLVLRALSGCRRPDDGHQVPEQPLKGHAFEVACLIGRVH
jgi:hypothetical protein